MFIEINGVDYGFMLINTRDILRIYKNANTGKAVFDIRNGTECTDADHEYEQMIARFKAAGQYI